ncbi:MAG TPA: hypothetical protein VGX03_21850 [Candidatus Binatia bacterium]|jgi:hypothetical protein|nr:hypothetical protein [Candidatus Binatia bacterium]
MAKRVREDDLPYRPVEAALVRSVVAGPKKTSEARVIPFPLPEEEQQPEPPVPARLGLEPFDQLIRILMSKSEKAALEQLAGRLAKQADTPLKISHLLRACVILLHHSEETLLEEARHGTRLVRPSNGNPIGIADFEQRVAQMVLTALKSALPL